MAKKMMLEATQDVVAGNQVAHPAGALYASPGDVPEGVPVRPVLVDVPDKGDAAPAPPTPAPAPKPPAKAAAK